MMHRLPQQLFALLLMVGLLGLPSTMWANQVRISPLVLSLSPDQRSAAFTLRNEGRTPVSMQVRVFAWQQDAEVGMLLDNTQSVVVSPAIVNISPRATQLIRVQVREVSPNTEKHYRVLIDQLPDPASASRDRVRVLTRYSLPVFVEPTIVGTPKLSAFLVECDGSDRLQLSVTNEGARRARLGEWSLQQNDRTVASHQGLAGYALPGQVLRLPITSFTAAQFANQLPLKWQVSTDVGVWQTDVSLVAEKVSCAFADQ